MDNKRLFSIYNWMLDFKGGGVWKGDVEFVTGGIWTSMNSLAWRTAGIRENNI